MNVLTGIQLALALLTGVLAQFKAVPGLDSAISAIEGAIASLETVANDPVTFAQLQSLKLKPLF